MNISGIRPTNEFYNVNSVESIRRAAQVAPVEAPVEKVAPVEAPKTEGRSAETEAKQTFGAYDYANQFKPGETYSMKGTDSDLRSLDVEKAVSDMQKDSVLHQYQYFVKDNAQATAAAASVRGAENFSL